MNTKLAVSVVLALGIAGCAYRPVVDPKRSDMAKYETDLVECWQIAEKGPGAGGGALVGAGAGEPRCSALPAAPAPARRTSVRSSRTA